MYNDRKSNILQGVCFGCLIFVLYIMTYTDLGTLKIGNALPMPIIAPIIAIGIYYGEWAGFWAGLITGVFVDAVSAKTVCFNTLFLLFAGLAAGLLIKYFLNRNILSALTLSLGFCLIYFALYFILHYFTPTSQGFQYLLFYALPSAVYSAVFMLPVFYLGQLIKKI